MNEKLLVFIGGFIFAVVTARKAYAPNRDEQLGSTPTPPPPSPQPNTGLFNECPEGMEKKPVFRKMYGMKPPEEKLERDRIAFEEAQRNAPCISNKEAAAIRNNRAANTLFPPPSAPPRGRNQVTQFTNALTQDRLNSIFNNNLFR